MNALDHCRARLFDLVHHVDTRVRMPLTHLEVVGPNKAFGSQYMCTLPRSVHAVLHHLLPIDPSTTYIDIGCGKGATLLVASRYRFRCIVGVEFSPELCRIARENIRHYIGPQKCKEITIICQDATDFSFPGGPLVVYFFNPFQ